MGFLKNILNPVGFRREIDYSRLPNKFKSRFYNEDYPRWFEWLSFVTGFTSLTPLTIDAERSLSRLVIGKRNPPQWMREKITDVQLAELQSFRKEAQLLADEEIRVLINIYMGHASRWTKFLFYRSMKRAQTKSRCNI